MGDEGCDVLATPTVEIARPEDVGALAALRLAVGWHASRSLLRAVIDWDGGRVFVVRDPESLGTTEGIVASTAATACDGGVGVIGNVIVRADQQRKGLGRRVMTAALDWMRARGVRSALLDATVEGRPLYLKLGFVPTGMSYYAHGSLGTMRREQLAAVAGGMTATRLDAASLGHIAALDRTAFGGDRLGLLARVLADPLSALYVASGEDESPRGYVIVRPQEAPSVGVRLGPWVARDRQAAAAVLRAALAADAPWRAATDDAPEDDVDVHMTLPGTSADELGLLEAIGLRIIEDDQLMQLDFGEDRTPGAARREKPRAYAEHPEWVYGWLAPMVF